MRRMILGASAAAAVLVAAAQPVQAYSDGSSDFLREVFSGRNSSGENSASGSSRATRSARRSRPTSARTQALRSLTTSGGSSSSGIASYYWQPQRVASGGWFNPDAMTAAHKTLPFGTRVRVTNLGNGRTVVVRINDRGPYIRGRVIDLSRAAAGVIGMRGSGLARVNLQILGRG